MSDQEKKQETAITSQPDAENKKKSTKPASTAQQAELSEEKLNEISGGIIVVCGKKS
jgi:bacteriocin-like protein